MENESFREFICRILSISKLKSKYVSILTNDENLQIYKNVFTHISIDPENNYEFYEILGDVTLNKAIVWYLKERFPKLQNAAGVKIIARLRINMVSKKNFSLLAQKLGFGRFIRAEEEFKTQREMSLLEDSFEAFFGATEFLLDKIICPGAGYGICYHLIKFILDKEPISLKYEDLYDPITRLKETFDYYRSNVPGRICPLIWGIMKIENYKNEENLQVVKLLQVDPNKQCSRRVLVTKTAPLLDEGKQAVCLEYLAFLEKNGYKKPVPEYYSSLE